MWEAFSMSQAPYENTFRQDGALCFAAEILELSHIGARFKELGEQSFHYVAPIEEHRLWKQLVEHLGFLIEAAQKPSPPTWAAIEAELKRDFGDYFAQAQRRVTRHVNEYFETQQMPLSEYLEWHRIGAENAWGLQGGS